MPYQRLGSTAFLNPGQCQNDLWVTNPLNAATPNNGDARFIIIQGTNPQQGILYVERWWTAQNRWLAESVPGPLRMYDDTVNPNAASGCSDTTSSGTISCALPGSRYITLNTNRGNRATATCNRTSLVRRDCSASNCTGEYR